MTMMIREVKGALAAANSALSAYSTVKHLAEDLLEARAEMDRLRDIERANDNLHAKIKQLEETLEIMSDPEALAVIKDGLEDDKAGRVHDHDDVEKELG